MTTTNERPAWARTEAAPAPPNPRLDETLFPPLTTVDLIRTPEGDYLGRFIDNHRNEAELFHVNSRITPCSDTNRPIDPEYVRAAHVWVRATGFVPRPGDIRMGVAAKHGAVLGPEHLPAPLSAYLDGLSAVDAGWWYALDRYLLLPTGLYQLAGGRLWCERLTDTAEHKRVTDTMFGLPEGQATAHLLLVAAPWRYLMVQGPRGYRRLLVDTGRALAEAEALAARTGLVATTTLDFEDNRLERHLRIDGLEHTVVAVVRLDGEQR